MHTVVVGILVAGGRVLLTLRSADRSAFPSRWALPGGHVDPGEREVEALRRELREELGIEVLDCEAEPVSRLDVTPAGAEAAVYLSAWRVRAWAGRPANLAPGEHDQLAWCTAGELAGLRWAHPEHRQLLQEVLDGRPG